MRATATRLEKKSFSSPDEVRSIPRAKAEFVKVGDRTIMRGTYEPGWRWSEHMKPVVGTESCEGHHLIYMVSGRMRVAVKGGEEVESGPGDIVEVPPGHDAWVVGKEPAVLVDFLVGETYAKRRD